MKKLFALALVTLLLVGLCACGSSEQITFTSDHLSPIHGIYISPVTEDSWGDPLNYYVLKKGSSLKIDFEKFAGDSATYDVGILDETDMLYEIFEVPLAVGDTLSFSGVGMFGTLTVTGADGTVNTYKGEGNTVDTTDE